MKDIEGHFLLNDIVCPDRIYHAVTRHKTIQWDGFTEDRGAELGALLKPL